MIVGAMVSQHSHHDVHMCHGRPGRPCCAHNTQHSHNQHFDCFYHILINSQCMYMIVGAIVCLHSNHNVHACHGRPGRPCRAHNTQHSHNWPFYCFYHVLINSQCIYMIVGAMVSQHSHHDVHVCHGRPGRPCCAHNTQHSHN